MTWEQLSARGSRYAAVLGSAMHLVDTGGNGPVVVFLHGNPTSSYLWRHVVVRLADRFRCIAVDLIGMGRSGKPDIRYDWADHRRHLTAVLDDLPLEVQGRLWLVGHDWGAALGIEYARTRPERVAGVAFLEGHLRPLPSWQSFDDDGRDLFQQLRDPHFGRRMVEDDNFFLTTVLPAGIRRTLEPTELQAYLEPFPTPRSRHPIWRWVTQIPVAGEPPDVAEVLTDNAAWLATTPLPRLLLWASPGAVISAELAAELTQTLPGLHAVHVGDGLHFLPEDQPGPIAAALHAWIAEAG
jgi:haloalkane dehalogenase